MKHQKGEVNPGAIVVGIILLAVVGGWLFPKMNWGRVSLGSPEVVVVNGEAKSQESNQIASYTAGVDAVNDKKEDAVNEVNSKVDDLIKAMKDFGIEPGDIKTNNISIYQNEESYWDNGVQKSRKGQWRVSNSIEVTIRDLARASDLTGILTSSGATNVWGPNFRMDDTSEIEKGLFDAAIADAKEKAEIIAKSSGRKLGKIMSVAEGEMMNDISPMYAVRDGMGGGGASIEAGSSTVSKSLTVTFELK